MTVTRPPLPVAPQLSLGPGRFMTHLSITEAVPGEERPEAEWGEHVSDEEYHGLTPP